MTTQDLRPPEDDEIPLTPDEVMVGIRTGVVDGPNARLYAREHAEVFILQRQVVKVINLPEFA